jgi:hypothetical protein
LLFGENIDIASLCSVNNNYNNVTVPLILNLPKTEGGKFMKYENLTLEIKNIWKLNNISIFSLVISAGVVIKNFLKCIENIGFAKPS